MDPEQREEQSIKLNESDFEPDSQLISQSESQSELQKNSQRESSSPKPAIEPAIDSLAYSAPSARAHLRRIARQMPAFDNIPLLIITFIISLFFLLMAYSTVWSYPWQSDWGHATGRITAIKPGYKLWRHITYEYEVDKHRYIGWEKFQSYGYTVWPGSVIKIRYKPNEPNMSVIETGANPATYFYLFAGIVPLLACVAGLLDGLRNLIRRLWKK